MDDPYHYTDMEIEELRGQVAALTAQLADFVRANNGLASVNLDLAMRGAELEKDAARYRKWRDLALVYKPLGHAFPDAMMAARTPSDIDAAIDAQPIAVPGAQHDQ